MLGANDIKAIQNFGAAGKLAAAQRKARCNAAYSAGVAAYEAGATAETELSGIEADAFRRGFEFARLTLAIGG